MLPPLFDAETLYFGNGEHVGGVLPPIAQDNVLTKAYAASIEARPGGWEHGCNYANDNLELVWMAPLGLTSAGPISRETIGALVAAVDAGRGILIYAETDEVAQRLGNLVILFAGGGHA